VRRLEDSLQNLPRADGYDSLLAYSPNGKIAFTSNLDGNGFDVYMMSPGANGQITDPVRLTANGSRSAWGHPYGPVQADDLAVEHVVLDDVPD